MKAFIARRVSDEGMGRILGEGMGNISTQMPLVEALPAIREIDGQDQPIWLITEGLPNWLEYEPGFSAEEVQVGSADKGFRHLAEEYLFLFKAPAHLVLNARKDIQVYRNSTKGMLYLGYKANGATGERRGKPH